MFKPPITSNILEWITRRTVIQLMRDEMGLAVIEREIDRTERRSPFFCGNCVQIFAIGKIDRRLVGDGKIGPIVGQLSVLYQCDVSGRVPAYREWLMPIPVAVR